LVNIKQHWRAALREGAVVAAVVAAVGVAAPVRADTIRLDGWWSVNSAATVSITFNGADLTGHQLFGVQQGPAAAFSATDISTGGTFQAWAVNVFQKYSPFPTFGVGLTDVAGGAPGSMLSAAKAADLDLLYTQHAAVLQSPNASPTDSAAFQLALWAIVYGNGPDYSVAGAPLLANGTGATEAAQWLAQLRDSSLVLYSVSIWQAPGDPHPIGSTNGAQDLAVFSPLSPVPIDHVALFTGAGLAALLAAALRGRQT
jgi:hypothetical protein